MTTEIPPLNPDSIYREVLAAGEKWADAKAAYEALNDNTKSILADITSNFMESKISRTEAEMRALASGEYKIHLASLKAARKAWLLSQVQYDSLKMLSELRRTQESTRRTEMGMR